MLADTHDLDMRVIFHCLIQRWRELKQNPGKKGGKARCSLAPSRETRTKVPSFLLLASSFAAGRERRGSTDDEAAMEIRVRCGCGEPSCPEWAVVELQGVVQPQTSFAGDIRGLHIGRLCSAPSHSSSSKGGYTFTVGYHELAGTKVALKKPLLVLRKKKVTDGDQDSPAAAAEVEQELEVIGIIRHKILFKDRPKALISKPITKEKKTVQPAAN
ncbi:unnamed protein product [Urochloa humidicola]